MKTITKELQKKITPADALKLLKQGNQRFIQNLRLNRNLLQQVNETAEGQYPFATILSCIDSRTPAELIFDQGLGDIFSIRIAGNIINDDIIGSMEFACEIAGSKLIMVLGHTNCGAVKGACNHAQLGHLTALLEKIKPAIEQENTIIKDRDGNNSEFVNEVAKRNVQIAMSSIPAKSSIIKKLVESSAVAIVGGLYDVSTGEVTFFQ
ncbi:carbonic anhydrase family protein [Legionella londiniensis]|uniref:Carbonic anhydrase n=1 Tax=Legionella londiniensis TaxID=45068 RepID=A0A0W0VN96_9GAMM|nr:carbonic anhydrase family protein [Legionella londiniensis]KTD21286.1 carbonic anhydrase [Legionella londiniensis]STX93312.1 carbonic anhydrase [Legionella londiniensis]